MTLKSFLSFGIGYIRRLDHRYETSYPVVSSAAIDYVQSRPHSFPLSPVLQAKAKRIVSRESFMLCMVLSFRVVSSVYHAYSHSSMHCAYLTVWHASSSWILWW